ncbi:hypothetical protein C900_04815 [Fulvivirga imtechensis AK7]|uniref:Uncharacterized protein n=1 Tax=Fulvivirga imtechensis AK7 TaxID=1237149 RepID=L8JL99_9BACT|nr:pinensin family lanthipeptide [Fulvivirga imtechensis]ELR69590.1 hypothetical protein C900_04815 [Fulvivirga imtechensis AK7]
MKKSKLIISDLKVQSFVTSLDSAREKTVKGGISGSVCTICDWTNNCSPPTENCFTADTCSFPGVICNTNPGPGRNTNNEQVGNQQAGTK